MCLSHLSITRSDNILHIQSICTRCVSVLGKFEDLIHEAKAKAFDYRNCPRGSSRPRTCPRGLHHCIYYFRFLPARRTQCVARSLQSKDGWMAGSIHPSIHLSIYPFIQTMGWPYYGNAAIRPSVPPVWAYKSRTEGHINLKLKMQ